LERILRFFRPIFLRPFPVFFVPTVNVSKNAAERAAKVKCPVKMSNRSGSRLPSFYTITVFME
jgi:hypothetical protein